MQTKASNLHSLVSDAFGVSEFGHDNPRVSKFSYVGQNIALGYGFFLYRYPNWYAPFQQNFSTEISYPPF